MLVSFDAWLRISEVSALKPGDIWITGTKQTRSAVDGLADGNDRGLQFFVAFVPPRRRFACVFAREAHVRYFATWAMESGGVRPPLRAVGAPAAYRQSAAPSRDAAGAAGPVIGGSRRC